jgi:hypothetical protein
MWLTHRKCQQNDRDHKKIEISYECLFFFMQKFYFAKKLWLQAGFEPANFVTNKVSKHQRGFEMSSFETSTNLFVWHFVSLSIFSLGCENLLLAALFDVFV